MDGYLQGARVLLDVNGNGLPDAGEPTATTDANGRYSLDYSQVSSPVAGLRVIVTGGIDTDTGYAFTGMLTARADGSRAGQLVSPLTSLVDALVAQGLSLDEARAKVAAALGLTVADLATDPLVVLANQPGLYTRQVALQRAVQLLASANQGSQTAHEAQERVLRALATVIVAQNGTATVGEIVARASLSQASAARALADGHSPVNEAALVKDLGTRFEQESVELAADLFSYVDTQTPGYDRVAALLEVGRLHSPLFTLRGGTNEVLRGVVARGMGLR